MKTIALDFDGVIHKYAEGWKGETVISSGLVKGTKQAIRQIKDMGFRVVVYSTRASSEKGRDAMKVWMKKHAVVVDEITAKKPPAVVYIDDRGFTFKGDWKEAIEFIKSFKPWNR